VRCETWHIVHGLFDEKISVNEVFSIESSKTIVDFSELYIHDYAQLMFLVFLVNPIENFLDTLQLEYQLT